MTITKGVLSLGGSGGSSNSVSKQYDIYERFSAVESGASRAHTDATATLSRKAGAPQSFKFPLDDVSAGNFWTRLTVNSWQPVRAKKEIEPKAMHALALYHIADIWLPMPMTLSTAYNQTYTETEDIMVDRGMNVSDLGWQALVAGHGSSIGADMKNELNKAASALAGVNGSGKMGLGSIANQNMGLVYDGATLRPHNFSWRLTPKNRTEQAAIQAIVVALKKFSSPIVKGITGGEVNMATAVKANEEAAAEAKKAQEAANADAEAAIGESGFAKLKDEFSKAQDSLRNVGRLAIPATVSVEFWYKDGPNPHLFKVKDSFISSVEVNYTPTGSWNAYENGAPIETQITLSLKENAIITQTDIGKSGGY